MPDPDEKSSETVYISANGIASSTPQEAVDNSLAFENASNTGAGCSQASENIPTDSK